MSYKYFNIRAYFQLDFFPKNNKEKLLKTHQILRLGNIYTFFHVFQTEPPFPIVLIFCNSSLYNRRKFIKENDIIKISRSGQIQTRDQNCVRRQG